MFDFVSGVLYGGVLAALIVFMIWSRKADRRIAELVNSQTRDREEYVREYDSLLNGLRDMAAVKAENETLRKEVHGLQIQVEDYQLALGMYPPPHDNLRSQFRVV